MDSQILSLYAKGMTTREIVATFKEMYDADVSPTLISKVTDAVKEQDTEWKNRQLDALYPIVYMDCILGKVRQNSSIINKAVFLALGINTEGQKELQGMWLRRKSARNGGKSALTFSRLLLMNSGVHFLFFFRLMFCDSVFHCHGRKLSLCQLRAPPGKRNILLRLFLF